jgi:hypothetical protein
MFMSDSRYSIRDPISRYRSQHVGFGRRPRIALLRGVLARFCRQATGPRCEKSRREELCGNPCSARTRWRVGTGFKGNGAQGRLRSDPKSRKKSRRFIGIAQAAMVRLGGEPDGDDRDCRENDQVEGDAPGPAVCPFQKGRK